MFELADMKIQHVFQSVLTRTTIAANMNRTTLTSAGVPFKEFVVTCRCAPRPLNIFYSSAMHSNVLYSKLYTT